MKTCKAKYNRLLKKAESIALLSGWITFSICILVFFASVQTWSMNVQLFIIPSLLLIGVFVEINMIEAILHKIINRIFAPFHAKIEKRINRKFG